MKLSELKLAVIGLGYVGLPLAVEFGKRRTVIGFDISENRINQLRHGKDITHETTSEEIRAASDLFFSSDPDKLKDCNCFIITVPTPIDDYKKPDLSYLINASEIVGKALKDGDIVIYESTVYPGCTEEVCVPVLERVSRLKYNKNFYCGYSPERINPGDRVHRITNVIKVTSGSTPYAAELVDKLYSEIVLVGTHRVRSIKVAEAAKVIENTQRDLNIALINELAIIFNRLGIDTEEVLIAAGSKWNFLPFRPGLVGGHCIGVDPYYLTYKAEGMGYHPEIILAGRRMNDNMGVYIASQLIKTMTKKRIPIEGAKILVMGFAFKENCSDIRNTRVFDVIAELNEFCCCVDIYDPLVDAEEVKKEYGLKIIEKINRDTYDAILLAVAHNQFKQIGAAGIRALGKHKMVLYDLKYLLQPNEVDLRL